MFSEPQRLLLLLPWLLLGWAWLRSQRMPAGVDPQTWVRLGREARPRRMASVAVLRWLALLCWLLAWAEPRWGMEQIRVERSSYDIVFAVDCSRSMLAEDLAPSRKLAARQELTHLISRLEGNRFGLVGFAQEAFVFCPLTRDSSAASLFLEQLEENSFRRQGTNISQALTTAASLFPRKGNQGSRLLILLSDGEDRQGKPVEVARSLAQQKIVVYTVAIGSPEGAPIPQGNGEFLRDRQGQEVRTKADEATLKEIAAVTKGRCFRLSSSRDHLDPLIQSILEQDQRRLESELSSRLRHQYGWFVGLGLALLALGQALVPRLRRTA